MDDLASEVALRQLAMEDLAKAAPLVRTFTEAAVATVKALLTGDVSEASGLLDKIHSGAEASRSEYLLACVVEDLKWLRQKMETLSAAQENYLNTDFVELLFDADKRSRQTRAMPRIKRIARILTASLTLNPIPSPDETEEMMGLAVELSDEDVLVLRALNEKQQWYERDGSRTMTGLPLAAVPGLSQEVVLSTCGKLLSLGLIADPQQRAVSLGLASYPRGGGYMFLQRGQRFLRFAEEMGGSGVR